MDHRSAIERYYRAYRERDLETLRALLTADFRLTGPFGEFRGRDAMLEQIWPEVGKAWAARLEIFGDGPAYMVRYEHETVVGAARPAMRMAEHLRFEGDRIAEIEVFIGRVAEP